MSYVSSKMLLISTTHGQLSIFQFSLSQLSFKWILPTMFFTWCVYPSLEFARQFLDERLNERVSEQIMFSLANITIHKKKVLYFHVWVWRLQSFRSTRLAMRLLQVVMFFPSTIYLLLLFFSFPNSFSVSLAFRFRLTPILVVITFMLCLLRNEI